MNSSAGEAGLQIVPTLSTIREVQKFLAKYFAPTRLVAAPFLSQTTGRNVYLKLETELPTSSFKVRGAFWALAQRMNQGQVLEVVASSTGNHGAAVAYAAKQFAIKAKIFLPRNCNPVKRGRIVGLGAAIVESGRGDLASAFPATSIVLDMARILRSRPLYSVARLWTMARGGLPFLAERAAHAVVVLLGISLIVFVLVNGMLPPV